METYFDRRRVFVFLAFAFGLSWAFGLAVYLTGGLVNSPLLVEELGISLALVLIAGGYMLMPALSHALTRIVTGEGWKDVYLRLNLRRGWPYYLFMWFGPGILTLLGGALYFLIFPDRVDFTLNAMIEANPRMAQAIEQLGVPLLIALQTVQAMLLTPFINGFFTFGEEFGWRAYLQPKLMPLGGRKALLITGVIWGVWHWPVILMGHNYGLEYPGAPWAGLLMMVVFCVVVGVLLGWASFRTDSVWPAVIGHAALNGIAGLGLLFVSGPPRPLLGPAPTGIIGLIPWAAVALWIVLRPTSLVDGEARTAARERVTERPRKEHYDGRGIAGQ